MDGRLITIPRDGTHKTSLFLTGKSERCIFLVGSQNETLFSFPYAQELVKGLSGEWAFAQVMLGSSFVGYGAPDHQADADDVDSSLSVLSKEYGINEFVLYATGTGVQVALEVLANGSHAELVTRLALHGGIVSPDASKLFTVDAMQGRMEKAHALIAEKRGDDTAAMSKMYDVAVTPARLRRNATLTLQEALWQPIVGKSLTTCAETFHVVNVPTLFLISTEASYENTAQKALPKVLREVTDAMRLPSGDVEIAVLTATIDEHRRGLKSNGEKVAQILQRFLNEADIRRQKREEEAAAIAAEAQRKKRVELAKSLCA